MKAIPQALLGVLVILFSPFLSAQVTFSNANHLLAAGPHSSGTAMGIADMNSDGFDDLIHLINGKFLIIELQNSKGGPLLSRQVGSLGEKKQWMLTVGDVDNNGFNDVMTGGFFDTIKIFSADDLGGNYTLSTFPGTTIFAQGANFTDINNDGFLDAFVCNDLEINRIWEGVGDGSFLEANQWIDLSIPGSIDNSGNYASLWTDIDNDGDLDLYVAKCKEGATSSMDGRRINVLYINDGNNQFTEQGADYGLNIGHQSWTADFQDIDNDGDMDALVLNHDHGHQLLENDGTGHFTDITAGSGIDFTEEAYQGLMRDFDNDGFVDLLIAGKESALFYNNGDQTFTRAWEELPGQESFQSCAIGDLNHDGFLDIYTSYMDMVNVPIGYTDSLWMNDKNENHFLAVHLEGTMSNRNGVGARIEIYGDWGIQIREVRAGESYGIHNTFTKYFGLKDNSLVDSLLVRWPSGAVDAFQDISADQFIYIKEKECISPPVNLELSGAAILCPGDTLLIRAPEGLNYLWSNGANSSAIKAFEAGTYNVTITNSSSCTAVSENISVDFDPDETPAIYTTADAFNCPGDPIRLTASSSPAYRWSTGDTTQSIIVTGAGVFSVTIAGHCKDFISPPLVLNVFKVDLPIGIGDTISDTGSGLLLGLGDSLHWYDKEEGGTLLATGPEFITPIVSMDTVFWLENIVGNEVPTFYGGKPSRNNFGSFSNTGITGLNLKLDKELYLNSFKVYANYSGMRKISFVDKAVLITAVERMIPEGESRVMVEVALPKSDDIKVFVTNDVGLFSESPNPNIVFPYLLKNFGAITGSDNGHYNFFYDWEVRAIDSVFCTSPRVPVLLDFVIGTISPLAVAPLKIHPNPTEGLLYLKSEEPNSRGVLSISDLKGQKVWSKKDDTSSLQSIDISHLPNGIYLIKLVLDHRIFVAKVVVNH